MRQKGVPARLEQENANKVGQLEVRKVDNRGSYFEAPETVATATEAASSHASTDGEESSRPENYETMGDIDSSGDSWFTCEHCRSLFESSSLLAAHVDEQHTAVLPSTEYWGHAEFATRKKTMTLEERRRISRERMREKRNNMTEAEREQVREKARLAKRNKFHSLAEDKKEKERERARMYMRKKRMTMTEEERNKVREKARVAKRVKTATMPQPEKEKMKEKARLRMKQKRDSMTEEERAKVREKARVHARQRRLAKSLLNSQGQSSSDDKHDSGSIAEDLMAALRNWEDSASNTSEDTLSYDAYFSEDQLPSGGNNATIDDEQSGSSTIETVGPSQERQEHRDLAFSESMLQFQALNPDS